MPDFLATFPGVRQIISASMTFSHGITPSVCMLEIAPQDPTTIAPAGVLTLIGPGTRIVFPDCMVDRATYRLNESGFVTALQLRDRRWAWAFGSINGSYNILNTEIGGAPDTQATLDIQQFRHARQLAIYCLQAMGESGFDVTQMPTSIAPLAEWDHSNPAQALAELADMCGCRVVLGLDNAVHLAKVGVGAALPTANLMERGDTISSVVAPDSIQIVCAPTRFQMDFPLYPVGLDTDGTIRPINNLSYKPAAGWTREEPTASANIDNLVQWSNPASPLAYNTQRQLAQATVWRWYQLGFPNSAPLTVPGYGRVRYAEQIALETVQVASFIQGGTREYLPAQVIGTYWDRGGTLTNRGPRALYRRNFRIDTERQLVMFEDPVVFMGGTLASPQYLPANIVLRTACTIRDAVTWAFARLESNYVIPGNKYGTGPKVIRHDDVRLEFKPTALGTGAVSNLAEILPEVSYYGAAAAAEYQLKLPQDYAYAGLVAISPDGAIQQVSWNITENGTTTRAGRNTEFSSVVPPYKQRRLTEQFYADRFREAKVAAEANRRRLPGRYNPSNPRAAETLT